MPLSLRPRSQHEIAALTQRYGSFFMIPAELRAPVLDLPATLETCDDALRTFAAELAEVRASTQWNKDVKIAVLMRDMATVRLHMETLPAPFQQAAE